MIAGQLAALREPTDDALESLYNRGPTRVLDVDGTQEALDGRPVQEGIAVSTRSATEIHATIVEDSDGDPVRVDVEREDTTETVAADWVADPTGTGVVAASSTADTGAPVPFPFDLVAGPAGVDVDVLEIDVAGLYRDWREGEDLTDVWLKGAADGDPDADDPVGTRIDYHDRADADDETADLGVGFRVSWSGTLARGVAYQSGYLALYSATTPSEYLSFVEDYVLDHTAVQQNDDAAQSTLADLGGGQA